MEKRFDFIKTFVLPEDLRERIVSKYQGLADTIISLEPYGEEQLGVVMKNLSHKDALHIGSTVCTGGIKCLKDTRNSLKNRGLRISRSVQPQKDGTYKLIFIVVKIRK